MYNIDSIAQRMKVVLLSQGVWMPYKTHKQETEEVRKRHGTTKIRRVEVVLTENDHLIKAISLRNKIYNENRARTFPSPCDGMRIIPAGREFEHGELISKLIDEQNVEVEAFIRELPTVKSQAEYDLNDLYDEKMFPTPEEVRASFYNNLRCMPAPTTGAWGDWIQETVDIGQAELRERLIKSARKVIDSCAGDGKLYSSVLDNLADICELAGEFNLKEDPIIARAAKELKQVANEYNVETLREHKGIRRSTAERASNILKTLGLS